MTTMLREQFKWMEHGACRIGVRDVGNVFHPSDYTGNAAGPAKEICARCPVRAECLEHAIRAREKDGVWGGRTWYERRRIIKQRQAQAS